jgi:hypothetical protein
VNVNTNSEARSLNPEHQHSRFVQVLDILMSALFVFAAALQLNDPDPVQWVTVYMAAAVLSLAVALRRRVPTAPIGALAFVAIAWAAAIALRVPSASEYRHMFDAWEMKTPSVEEAREASGLAIVAAWMIVLLVRSRRAPVSA